MATSSLSGLADLVSTRQSYLITSHVSPDGDALGSMLALAHLLRARGASKVDCVNEDSVPAVYNWLPGAGDVLRTGQASPPYDVVFILDVGELDRIGTVSQLIGPESTVVVMDHHLSSEPCGDVNFLDSSFAATGEIIVELFNALDVPLSYDAALCAYVAQITDTGGFRYSNTNSRSHRIAAQLLEAEIDVADISMRMFDIMSMGKFELLRRYVNKVDFLLDGRVAVGELDRQDRTDAHAKDEDTEGVINFARNVQGVQLAILLKEMDDNTTKVSFRSDAAFNSAELLKEFGGGGHAAAAGATLNMALDEARKAILERVTDRMDGC